MTHEEIIIYANWTALAIAALAVLGEWLHARRVARLSRLAFGPDNRPRRWTKLAPPMRVLALAGVVWSLFTLIAFNSLSRDRDRRAAVTRHLMVLLDVSPSMQLADAGEGGGQRRAARAAEVLKSVLNRVPGDNVRFSAASFYTEARMLARECQDRELMVHFAAEVPFFYTYKPGKTDLLKSLNQAGGFMQDWPRKSTTLLVISDGDSVPPAGLKPMPSAVADVLFVGVGETGRGTFIDGHLSRQDGATLSQLARRLGGKYFDGNLRQLPSDALQKLNAADPRGAKWQADRRLVALAVLGVSAALLCLVPILLEFFGSAWKPAPPAARGEFQPAEVAT
ncbi:MAG: VWA domain-containing protein [Verrucomicrobia bacterium]|nr:VWA domain-containing protein [Verrucomicrobiota bacterium]